MSFKTVSLFQLDLFLFFLLYISPLLSSCLDKAYTDARLNDFNVKCSDENPIYFEPEQCSSRNCICVDPDTGTVFDGSEHNINSNYECFSKLVKLDIGIPKDQMIEQLPQLNEAKTDVLIAEKTKIMNVVIKKSLQYFLNTTLRTKYSIESIQRNDSPSVDALFSYYSIKFFLFGSNNDIDSSMENMKLEIDSGKMGSIRINKNISRIQFLDSKKENSNKYSEISTDRKKDKQLSANGVEPAQSDFPNDKAGDVADFQINKTPTDYENENYNSKQNAKSFWQSNIDFFLKQPGILAGFIGALLTGILLFVLFLVFCIYRLRKKDEGSYTLDEAKKVQINPAYTRAPTREFYA